MKTFMMAMALTLATTAGAPAQESTAPAVKSQATVTLAKISQDGLVEIDWDAVEKVAAESSPPDLIGYARLMLAIRDGTWKPLVQEGK